MVGVRMETETKIDFNPRIPSLPRASAAPMLRLWYCQRCTHLLLPPGMTGTIAEDGQRYCATCAPFEVSDAPATSLFNVAPSKHVFTDMIPETAGAAAKSRFNTSSAGKDRDSRAAEASRKLWMVVGVAAVVVLGGVTVVHKFSSLKKSNSTLQASKTDESIVARKIVIAGTDSTTNALSKDKTGAPAKPLVDEKAERLAALNRAGGLFAPSSQSNSNSNGNTAPPVASDGGDTQRVSVSNPPNVLSASLSEKQQTGASSLRIEDFESQFRSASGFIESEKFSDADSLIVKISSDFSKAEWFAQQQKRVVEFRDKLEVQKQAFKQRVDEAVAAAKNAKNKDQLEALDRNWLSKRALGESTVQMAQPVFDAITVARSTLNAEFAARCKQIEVNFEKLAKRSQVKLNKTESEYALKFVDDTRALLRDDCELRDKYADKLAELNYDVSQTVSPERTVLGVEPVGRGSATTILAYDFSNRDQQKPWKFESDGQSPDKNLMSFDERGKFLVIKLNGSHPHDPGKGKRAPAAVMPFYFENTHWSFEADSAVLPVSGKEKRNSRPIYGIQISDGTDIIQVFAQECKRTEWGFGVRGVNEKTPHNNALAKLDDTGPMHFRIASEGGKIELSAWGRDKPIHISAPPKFEPKFVGLFVETHENEENVAVSFTNVTLKGGLSTSRVNELYNQHRAESVKAFKAQLACKLPKSAPIQPKK